MSTATERRSTTPPAGLTRYKLLEIERARRREAKIVVDMIQGELLPHAVLTLAERAHPSPDRGDMLADAQVDALNAGGVDGPTVHGQHLLNSRPRAEDHPRAHPHQAPPAYRLDHLRIEEPGQG